MHFSKIVYISACQISVCYLLIFKEHTANILLKLVAESISYTNKISDNYCGLGCICLYPYILKHCNLSAYLYY